MLLSPLLVRPTPDVLPIVLYFPKVGVLLVPLTVALFEVDFESEEEEGDVELELLPKTFDSLFLSLLLNLLLVVVVVVVVVFVVVVVVVVVVGFVDERLELFPKLNVDFVGLFDADESELDALCNVLCLVEDSFVLEALLFLL